MPVILTSVAATAGFLENCRVTFTKGLNCVIGARGTCKSTLVESIRFVFNADERRVRVLLGEEDDTSSFMGMIRETLGGGSVRCEILETHDQGHFSIERDTQSQPRIYREGVKEHTDTDLLSKIEIYSQGDLQRIAEDDELRLQLIDRPNLSRIRKHRRRQEEIASMLRDLGKQVRSHRNNVEQLKISIRSLPELRRQLSELQGGRPDLSRTLDIARAEHLERQLFKRTLDRAITDRDDILLIAGDALLRSRAVRDSLARVALRATPELHEAADTIAKAIEALVTALNSACSTKKLDLLSVASVASLMIEELDQPYYELRKSEQAANEALRKEDVLKHQIEHLEALEKELDVNEQGLHDVSTERITLRHEFKRLADEIYELRIAEVNEINSHHASLVVLTLEQGGQSDSYARQVEALLQGSRLRSRDEIAQDIASALTPAELIDLVESGDTQRLALSIDRDLAQVTRLMSFLLDCPDLYDLEGHIFESRLNITMFDDGQPKSVQTLSKGQKATALLPLILRATPYPLIFDQPEDDLDNRFIFNSLIQSIRNLRVERQLIFITHNANIPVIGEADNVVVMKMESPTRAAPALAGTVDERKREIIELLEGGTVAFRERQRRYDTLLKE